MKQTPLDTEFYSYHRRHRLRRRRHHQSPALSFWPLTRQAKHFLASALVVAIQLDPLCRRRCWSSPPMMDRLPCPFCSDLLNGYAGTTSAAQCFLPTPPIQAFSPLVIVPAALLLPVAGSGLHTASAMLYPILKVLMMPLAALLYDTLGAWTAAADPRRIPGRCWPPHRNRIHAAAVDREKPPLSPL